MDWLSLMKTLARLIGWSLLGGGVVFLLTLLGWRLFVGYLLGGGK